MSENAMERDTGTEIGDSRHSKDPPPADDDVKPVDIDKVCIQAAFYGHNCYAVSVENLLS